MGITFTTSMATGTTTTSATLSAFTLMSMPNDTDTFPTWSWLRLSMMGGNKDTQKVSNAEVRMLNGERTLLRHADRLPRIEPMTLGTKAKREYKLHQQKQGHYTRNNVQEGSGSMMVSKNTFDTHLNHIGTRDVYET